jgi:ComF family protein
VTRSASNWRDRLSNATRLALDLLYPPVCGGCGQAGAGWWCPNCDRDMPRLNDREQQRDLMLGSGQSLRVWSAARYADPLRKALHAMKYGQSPHIAAGLTPMLTALWPALDPTPDVLLAVPLHPSRERERGYNQSAWLARNLARATGVPAPDNMLRRTRHTPQQMRLGATERLANVAGAFAINPANRPMLQEKIVLIIDDVFTTGATLAECARACLDGGATHVLAMTLARAERVEDHQT